MRYWDLTFEVSRGLKRLLDWEQALELLRPPES